jgi:outer membrane beta-barrel protein
MRFFVAAALVMAIACSPLIALAGDDDDDRGLETLAVQNRQFTMAHEFSAWIGTLPLDAFEKGLTFTGAYTLHFNDIIAWEVGQFTYSYGIDAELKEELENSVSLKPTPFEVVKWFATTNLVFKPVYGKLAVLNRSTIFSELFIVLGGGYGKLTITERAVIDVGIGMRIYAGKYVSFRLDVRDYMFVNRDDIHNELWIALGICLSFG